MITAIYFFSGVLLVLLGFFQKKTMRVKKNEIDCYFFYICIVALSCFFIPTLNEIYEYSRNDVVSSDSAKLSYALYILIYATSTLLIQPIFYHFEMKNKKKEFRSLPSESYLILLVAVAVPLFFSIREAAELIQRSGFEVFLADRIVLLSGKAYMGLFILFPIVVVISYCLDRFFLGAKRFEYKKLIAAAALVFLASLPMVLLGGRTNLFFGVLALIFSLGIWYLRNKRRGELGRLVRVGVFFLGGALIGANLLGAIREAVMSSSSDYSMHSEQKIPLEGVVLAMSSYENVYILFDQKFDAYRYGATIFAATLGLIPRSIFPEKPIGAGPVMKNIISPNSYDLSGGENISSVTTGLPTEGYINFGWVGALIVPIIMLPLLWFASWMNSRASNSIEVVVGAFIFLRVMSYVNGEFFGVSLHIMMTLLILLSCKFLLKNVPRVKFHRN